LEGAPTVKSFSVAVPLFVILKCAVSELALSRLIL